MKKLLTIIVIAFLSTTLITDARGGGGGGGHSSGGGRSSSSFSSSRTGARSITGPAAAVKPSTPTISTRPTATTQTKTIPTTTKVGSKTYSKTANVVSKDYQPHFSGGYVPPMGSTVQYKQSSMLDWLPFYLIMTSNGHREAVVTTPAGTSTPATTKVIQEEGTDTMYIVNWVITILFGIGIIWFITWLVNKYTKKDEYGYI